jgi:hypothetical protein
MLAGNPALPFPEAFMTRTPRSGNIAIPVRA